MITNKEYAVYDTSGDHMYTVKVIENLVNSGEDYVLYASGATNWSSDIRHREMLRVKDTGNNIEIIFSNFKVVDVVHPFTVAGLDIDYDEEQYLFILLSIKNYLQKKDRINGNFIYDLIIKEISDKFII